LRPFLSLRFLRGVQRQLRRHHPDLVHIHTAGHAGFWEKALFGAMARARSVPYVMHLHGGDFDLFLQNLRPRMARFAARSLGHAAAVITTTARWGPLLQRFVPRERIVVVPNAIHVDDFTPVAQPRRGPSVRLLFLGMVSARKGLDELAQALRELLRHGCTGFELDVAGGEEVPGELLRLRRLYATPGLHERVRFHGPLFGADKLRLLQSADVFVLPSRNESFGIANLEAMACGLPLVSTRTGAIPDYLVDGVSGFLVEPRDVDALTHALGRLISDAALRERMGEEGRRRVRAYDWEEAVPLLATLYERCVAATEKRDAVSSPE
jgi:glycosyltransferase involved in cell wall biosynthesis